MSIEELRAQMRAAIDKNDVDAMDSIAIQIVASKKERAKVEADRLLKESEALADVREKLAAKTHQMLKGIPGLDKELVAVKAWGFTYKVDKANPNEPDIVYKSVSLTTAAVKAPKAGGGGSTGKSKDEFGLSLGEIFDKFATDEDKTKLAAATSGSSQWQVKVAVKKRAIASGLLAPVK